MDTNKKVGMREDLSKEGKGRQIVQEQDSLSSNTMISLIHIAAVLLQ